MGVIKSIISVIRNKSWMFFIMAALLLLLAIFLSSEILLGLAVGVAIFAFIGVSVKQATKELEEKNKDLETQNASLREEKKELLNRHIDITQIKDVLKLVLTEVESVDVRTYDHKLTDTIRFIGALRIKIKAQYGIDVDELRFKYDGDTLLVANVNPKYLAFSERTLNWDFCFTMEYVTHKILGFIPKEMFWRTKDSNDKYTIEQAELIRKEVEKQLNENGLDSIDWIKESIQYKVLTGLQKMFPTTKIQILDSYDESFQLLQDFMNEQQKSTKALHV